MNEHLSSRGGERDPFLLQNLRMALSCLYSLPSAQSRVPLTAESQAQAHSYLIDFQSRNVRRKATSIHQRHRDSKDGGDPATSLELPLDADHCGSSFYASVPLLLYSRSHGHVQIQTPSHATERLFCAQTILHRLRRMKTADAMDWETEFPHVPQVNISSVLEHAGVTKSIDESNPQVVQQSSRYWSHFTKCNCEYLASFHGPFLGQVLWKYHQETWGSIPPGQLPKGYDAWGIGIGLEERIKGEMTLLSLATMAYMNAYVHTLESILSSNSKGQTHVLGPLLDTLSSAMAVTALRLRYTSASVSSQGPNAHAVETPLVTLITQAMDLVSQIASSLTMEQLFSLGAAQLQQFDPNVRKQILDGNGTIHLITRNTCFCSALASIPDSLLGSPGGARGRLSIDPRCLQHTNTELRTFHTGIDLVRNCLGHVLDSCERYGDGLQAEEMDVKGHVLKTCERWTLYVPLPLNFVQQIVPITLQFLSNSPYLYNQASELSQLESAVFALLVRINEGACKTLDQILAEAAGLSAESNNTNKHQQGRKRQSSKAKKRHKERLNQVVTDGGDVKRMNAKKEHHHRGAVACRTAVLCWEGAIAFAKKTLEHMSKSPSTIVAGEGPVGFICTCASACLPHIIRTNDDTDTELFEKVFHALNLICFNSNASVRALSYEHITMIHSILIEKTKDSSREMSLMDSGTVQNICECVLSLASKCAYPDNYFSNLGLDNDEPLEIERNDVRDVLRSVTVWRESDQHPPAVSLMILQRLLQHCAQVICDDSIKLPPEAAVHVLSSPARLLNRLAERFVSTNDIPNFDRITEMFIIVLSCIRISSMKVLNAFTRGDPMNEIIPVSRLISLAVSSFSPFYSSLVNLVESGRYDEQVKNELQQSLGLSILATTASISTIPELLAVSSLGRTVYDIRGAMRGPGGEDHVGCVALSRCACESDHLAFYVLNSVALVKSQSLPSIMIEFSHIHDQLYTSEGKRGLGVLHGEGVTPKSRRTFLSAVSRLGLVAIKKAPEYTDEIGKELHRLFERPFSVVSSVNESTSDVERFLYYAEASFDLSSFPSDFCASLFSTDQKPQVRDHVQSLIDTCVSGYGFVTANETSDAIIQVMFKYRLLF